MMALSKNPNPINGIALWKATVKPTNKNSEVQKYNMLRHW